MKKHRDGKRDITGHLILYNSHLGEFEVMNSDDEIYAPTFPTVEAARYFILGLMYCPPEPNNNNNKKKGKKND